MEVLEFQTQVQNMVQTLQMNQLCTLKKQFLRKTLSQLAIMTGCLQLNESLRTKEHVDKGAKQ